MEAFGLPFDVVAYRKHYVPDWREMYRRLGIPDHRLDEANELWEERFADGGETVVPFIGVDAALRRLREAGAGLGVVTAGGPGGGAAPRVPNRLSDLFCGRVV